MTDSPNDIVRRHYSTDEHLRIRQETHEKYTVPHVSFSDWALACVPWSGDEAVLDVGCGNGLYYPSLIKQHPNLRYVGLDLVTTMLEKHPVTEGLLQADAAILPFANNTFDIIMANHMLFHVGDIDQALREFKRVLKPDGLLMIATNSTQTMPELQVLMRRAIVLLTRNGSASVRAPSMPSDSFALENGTRLLSRYFFGVVRYDLPTALVFPESDPAMVYLESTRDLRQSLLPADVEWDDVMVIMRQQINQLVKHLGELVINKQAGVLLASNGGGFIQEYLRIQNQ